MQGVGGQQISHPRQVLSALAGVGAVEPPSWHPKLTPVSRAHLFEGLHEAGLEVPEPDFVRDSVLAAARLSGPSKHVSRRGVAFTHKSHS